MKKIAINDLSFIPASHEDSINPGTEKKIIFTDKDLDSKKRIKMINWARIRPGKSFTAHYHEDMDEIFVIISGRAKIVVDRKSEILKEKDAVFIPMGSVHRMEDIGEKGVNYMVIGLSLNKGGKTVITDKK